MKRIETPYGWVDVPDTYVEPNGSFWVEPDDDSRPDDSEDSTAPAEDDDRSTKKKEGQK